LSRDNEGHNILLQAGDIVTVGEKQVFYVRGEVRNPGVYLFQSGMTVLKAINIAAGLSQFANSKEIELLRAGENGLTTKTFINLKAIENGKKADIPLRANDTIIVPKRMF